MNKEEMMELLVWSKAHKEAELAERLRKENIAKNVYMEMITAPWSGVPKEELTDIKDVKWGEDEAYLNYINTIDMEDENLFQYAGVGDFDSVESYKLANFLANTDEHYEEIIELLKDNYESKIYKPQIWSLMGYRNKRLEKGVGQDVTAEQLQNLLNEKNYDGLKDILSDLTQRPVNIEEVEYFVASQIDVQTFLDKHKEHIKDRIYSIINIRTFGDNLREYFSISSRYYRSLSAKKAWITRRKRQAIQEVF